MSIMDSVKNMADAELNLREGNLTLCLNGLKVFEKNQNQVFIICRVKCAEER
jgi:hypothetical protein